MQRRGRLPDLHSALACERPEMYRERFGRVQTSEVFKTSEVSLHHNPQQIFISHAYEDAAQNRFIHQKSRIELIRNLLWPKPKLKCVVALAKHQVHRQSF